MRCKEVDEEAGDGERIGERECREDEDERGRGDPVPPPKSGRTGIGYGA